MPLVEFIYLVFTRTPGGVTVGDSGLCCCVPCLSSSIIFLCLLILTFIKNFKKTHCFTENLHRLFRYCFHIKALTLPLLVCLWMADVWNTLQCQGQTELLRTRLFQASKHLHPKDNLPRAASPLALAICPSPFPVHLPAVSLIDLMDDKGNVLVS